jgi:Pyocin activator protein PrtN
VSCSIWRWRSASSGRSSSNSATLDCRDFFGHLTVEKLLRKALRGDIALPIVRIETSQKAQRGVHLVDLAAYIDKRRAVALKECRQLTGTT